MNARRLTPKPVEKPWGRRDLPTCFHGITTHSNRIGEIWFEDIAEPDRPLLVKYLFTSERLSIQVHPGPEAARAAGFSDGKDEAWLILATDDGAEIGLGLREPVSREKLRDAALDGSIVDLVDWRPTAAGDFLYSPAGTIHALGAGLTLIEVQQNVDATYRLHDYGRPRELHVDAAVAVADPRPAESIATSRPIDDERLLLAEGGAFVTERWVGPLCGIVLADPHRPVWFIPLTSDGKIAGETLEAGQVWIADGATEITIGDEDSLLVAYAGAVVDPNLINQTGTKGLTASR